MTSHSPSCTTRDANVESSPVRNPRTDSSSFNSRDSPPSFDLVDVSSVMKSWSYQPRSSQHAQIHTVLFSNNHASISASKPKSSAPESTDACILIANKTTLQPQEIKRRPTASADHSGFFYFQKKLPKCHMMALWLTPILAFCYFSFWIFMNLNNNQVNIFPAFMVAWLRMVSKAELWESWRRSNQLPLYPLSCHADRTGPPTSEYWTQNGPGWLKNHRKNQAHIPAGHSSIKHKMKQYATIVIQEKWTFSPWNLILIFGKRQPIFAISLGPGLCNKKFNSRIRKKLQLIRRSMRMDLLNEQSPTS